MNPTSDLPGAPTLRNASDARSASDLRVIAPPPLVYAGAIVIGALLDRLVPLGSAPRVAWLGAVLIALGLAGSIWAVATFRRAGTSLIPRGQTRAFVATGPYKLTRNPMYVGLTLQAIGLLLILGSVWGYALLAVALVIIHIGVIKPEEAHLEARFGQDYLDYKRRVRRWV